MDDQENPLSETLADRSARKTRKPAALKRTRASSAGTDAGQDALAAPEPAIKPVRARRGRAPGAVEEPGLFGAESAPAAAAEVSAPVANSCEGLFQAEMPSRAVLSPTRTADGSGKDADFSPVADSDSAHEQTEEATGSNQDAGAPRDSQESGDQAPAGGRGPDQGGAQGGGGAAAIDDRKPWWERKKDKKKQKWLEKQQARAGNGGGHGHGGGSGFGGSGHGSAGHATGPERPPQQPSPPLLVMQVGALPSQAQHADAVALDVLADELAKDNAPLDLTEIHGSGAVELLPRVRALGESPFGAPSRRTLVEMVFAWAAREKRAFHERGWLDVTDAGFGFIVHRATSYRLYPESTCVPAALIRRHGLRRGQELELIAQPPQNGERCPCAVRILSVMGTTSEAAREVTLFEELIPYYPLSRILLEAPDIHKDISMRAIDLLTPVGFGQRGLIVAPPRTGKTVLLQNIANSISNNFPEATLILLLIDERPEEVTDFRRHTKGEVVSSTFDEAPESHVHAAEMVIEKARRLVELGKHVVILLDSITRLARAYNALAGSGGKTMSGGIESNALQRPKRFFGSARNIEGGGSLTILGTALVDTGSRMDEVIFEEFKGTGNMELHLDRGLSDKRIFPAINIDRSGTRKEELIYHPEEMLRVYGLRRAMQGIPAIEAMDMFIQRLKKTRTNAEFLLSLNR